MIKFSDLKVNGTTAERYGHHAGGPSKEDSAPGAAARRNNIRARLVTVAKVVEKMLRKRDKASLSTNRRLIRYLK